MVLNPTTAQPVPLDLLEPLEKTELTENLEKLAKTEQKHLEATMSRRALASHVLLEKLDLQDPTVLQAHLGQTETPEHLETQEPLAPLDHPDL